MREEPSLDAEDGRSSLDRDHTPEHVAGSDRPARVESKLAVPTGEDDRARSRMIATGRHVDDLAFAQRWRLVQQPQQNGQRSGPHHLRGRRAQLLAEIEEHEAAHGVAAVTSCFSSSCSTNAPTSRAAISGVTSNSATIRATISSTLRRPSISSHTRLPTALSPRNTLLSSERMTASPSMTRQAVAGFFERITGRDSPRGRTGSGEPSTRWDWS